MVDVDMVCPLGLGVNLYGASSVTFSMEFVFYTNILVSASAGTSADTSDATSSKTASCLSCGEALQTEAALAKHHREVHSSADVSSEASVGSNSTGGQNNDASVARVACEKCGRTFKNKSNLKIHMLTHSGLKPFG